MRGKSEETPTESSSNSERQTRQTNSDENANVNQQQQVRREKAPEIPPPPYVTTVQPISNPTPPSINVLQYSSLNNQRTQRTTIPHNHQLGRYSADILCPKCDAIVHTRAETSITIITVLLVCVLFFCCLCLAFIPFCMLFCKRTIHYCPRCKSVLGEVREFQ